MRKRQEKQPFVVIYIQSFPHPRSKVKHKRAIKILAIYGKDNSLLKLTVVSFEATEHKRQF
jgi:hypothetical protein